MKNITTVLFIILLLVAATAAQAQVPNLQAENSFGGSYSDFGFSIQQTKDGGYIMAGGSESNSGDVQGNHGDDDFWVAKLNKKGAIQWQKALGGFNDEKAFSVQQTADGGYIVAGQANSNSGNVTGNHGNLDFWVVKLDSSGNLIWQRSLGGSKSDFATCIRQTKDGGYIAAGGSFSNDAEVTGHHGPDITADYWVVKLNANGNIQWERSYGGSNGDIAMSVWQTKDGGYVVAGNSTSNDGDVTGVHDLVYGDAWIIKTDGSGNLQWQKAFGGSDYEQANSIQQTKDSGYVFTGWTRSNEGDVSGNHGNYDFWVVKLDKRGAAQWEKCFGGSNGDLAYSIQQTPDNGYIVAGGTGSADGDVTGLHGGLREDFWVIKLDANAGLQWQKTLGGTELEEARSVDQTKDSGYVIAGWSGFANVNNGDVTGNHGNYDFWVAKLAPETAVSSLNVAPVNNAATVQPMIPLLTVSPNPAGSYINIDIVNSKETALLRITNSTGKLMLEKNIAIPGGNIHEQFNIAAFAPGVYYIHLKSGDSFITRKFIKE